MHRELLNDDYKNAVNHLRVALHTTPPAIEALHPFIQVLTVGLSIMNMDTFLLGKNPFIQLHKLFDYYVFLPIIAMFF